MLQRFFKLIVALIMDDLSNDLCNYLLFLIYIQLDNNEDKAFECLDKISVLDRADMYVKAAEHVYKVVLIYNNQAGKKIMLRIILQKVVTVGQVTGAENYVEDLHIVLR